MSWSDNPIPCQLPDVKLWTAKTPSTWLSNLRWMSSNWMWVGTVCSRLKADSFAEPRKTRNKLWWCGRQTMTLITLDFHLHNGQVDHIIRQTMATLRAESTYSFYSHSVSQMTRAETMTTTDPRASARTCKKTPRMLRFLGLDFSVFAVFALAWDEFSSS